MTLHIPLYNLCVYRPFNQLYNLRIYVQSTDPAACGIFNTQTSIPPTPFPPPSPQYLHDPSPPPLNLHIYV